jgi:hypothetical protein
MNIVNLDRKRKLLPLEIEQNMMHHSEEDMAVDKETTSTRQ